ncbi:MAG: hypothetical protein ACJ8F7_22355, partial [Gemmataceae bacterium]
DTTVGKATDKAQDMMGKVTDRAQDIASKVSDRAQDVANRARDMAQNAGQKAEDVTHRAGSAMESLGQTIRDRGPHEGTLGQVAGKAAENLSSAGHYLQEEGLQGIAEDLTDMVRRNPIPALLIGIGIGFLIARATSSRS